MKETWAARVGNALFGPTDRWVFVLVIARQPNRNDLPAGEDTLGSLPYTKIAVYSTPERAMRAAAWTASLEQWQLKGDREGGFLSKEENDQWKLVREAWGSKAEAARDAMLEPASWRRYESTDGKPVWFYRGPVAYDYRIIANRVDRWGELASDVPAEIRSSFG